jgi:hypothetical protein
MPTWQFRERERSGKRGGEGGRSGRGRVNCNGSERLLPAAPCRRYEKANEEASLRCPFLEVRPLLGLRYLRCFAQQDPSNTTRSAAIITPIQAECRRRLHAATWYILHQNFGEALPSFDNHVVSPALHSFRKFSQPLRSYSSNQLIWPRSPIKLAGRTCRP